MLTTTILWKSKSTINSMVFPKRPYNFSRDLQSTISGDYYFMVFDLQGRHISILQHDLYQNTMQVMIDLDY